MQGGIYPYAYRPQGLVAVQVSGGSTYPWEQDCTAYFHNPQIREDVGSRVSCGAVLSAELKSIFRPIPLASQAIHSYGMVRKSTDIGHDTKRASNLRYAGSLTLLNHAYLMSKSQRF
jgi:hypothetical protein